jgi:plasmid stabilization system protein ParE
MMPYTVSPQAIKDLDEIWDYVAADSPTAADRLIDTIWA